MFARARWRARSLEHCVVDRPDTGNRVGPSQDAFLSAVAHELDTSRHYRGYADLLDDLESMDILPEAIEAIRDESARAGLVDELLDISRLGALGVRDLTPREFDLGDWARQSGNRNRPSTSRQYQLASNCELLAFIHSADRDKMSRGNSNQPHF